MQYLKPVMDIAARLGGTALKDGAPGILGRSNGKGAVERKEEEGRQRGGGGRIYTRRDCTAIAVPINFIVKAGVAILLWAGRQLSYAKKSTEESLGITAAST